jgi:UDP-glucose 4-epimerase
MLEQLALSYAEGFGLRSVIVRLFSVYGPWLYKQLLWDICSRLDGGVQSLELGGNGGELRDWTEVRDVARLLHQAAGAASTSVPVINGGSGVATPVRDVATMLVRAWGRDVPVYFSGTSRLGDPYSLVSSPCVVGDVSFMWGTSVSDGIAAYIDWFRRESTR